ncbi:MAG: hypothetical protein KAI25_07540 [Hyphomicrobiaceae bacterium]|nr:hypothetical protein [Hyphomicrobiaceae bacterium]
MADYPKINGQIYSFASTEIKIGAAIYTGLTDISYNQTLEPGIFRGTRPEKLARTIGEHNVEGSFTMVKVEYQELIAALGDGYMQTPFDITVTYAETNSPIVTDVLTACRITSEEDSHSQGTDALVVACDLDIIKMTRNGLLPIVGQL